MSELEKLRAVAFMRKNRIRDLEVQLIATQRQLQELQERLTLSGQEKTILKGHDDGCIRTGELRPILNRVSGCGQDN